MFRPCSFGEQGLLPLSGFELRFLGFPACNMVTATAPTAVLFLQKLPVIDGSAKIRQIILCGFEYELWRRKDKETLYFGLILFS